MDVFLHPWYMIAGALLVSAPIIIHLINRMRFRRVRWAAMEFLLKSQKRNRRRLILEQFILLALRCLLVLLAGFLVARFIGKTGLFGGENSTLHLAVLDDTVSMADRWRDEGEVRKAFDAARARVKQLAKDAATAASPQRLKLVALSNPENVLFNDRLNPQTLEDLNKKLDELTPSAVHARPLDAVKWAREQVGGAQEPQRFLHLMADLRDTDWSGSEADALAKELDGLTGAGTRVLLFDVAHPDRAKTANDALNNDNMAVSDLRPETRFAAEGMPVQFSLTVHNYSPAERKGVFLDVRVNGEVRFEASQPLDVKPGETRHTFLLAFNRPGYNVVSVAVTGEDAGVAEDNIRVAVVEVRKQVPVLMIDGSDTSPSLPRDSFFLATVLNVAKGYQAVVKSPRDLEEMDLAPYPCIYLLNVPLLTDKAVKRLEDYVARGGRAAFFLGDKVQAGFYNRVFYKNGQGLFPVPLETRPTDKPPAEEKLRRLFEDQYQVYLRDPEHPVLAMAAQPKYREVFKFLMIDQYWPAQPRFQWNVDPSRVQELITLPNRKAVDDYRARAAELNNQLPLNDEKFAKFRPTLESYQRQIRDALAGEYLYTLGNALERLLTDRGDPSDPAKRPDLGEFWAVPEVQKLKADLNALRQAVQFGDPLMLTAKFGKGQTVAVLTTAGRNWNDWAGGCPASWTYPMMMLDLQKYLTGVGDEGTALVGAPLEVVVDAARYEPKARVLLQAAPREAKGDAVAAAQGGAGETQAQDLGDVPGVIEGSTLTFKIPNTRVPGVYYVRLQPVPEAGTEPPRPEERAFVFNIDTQAESNLKRATRDSLERGPASGSTGRAADQARVSLVTPDVTSLKELVAPKRKDMSESPWLYLIFLLILIVEQALAVHLSHHLKSGETTAAPGTGAGRMTPAEAAA